MRYMILVWEYGEKINARLIKDDEGHVKLFPDFASADYYADKCSTDYYQIIDTEKNED